MMTRSQRADGTTGERDSASDRTMSVVVVDDDKNFVEALSANLVDNGFEVRGYTDSVAALDELIGSASCDAILLDWNMPRLNGAAFLKLLRDAGVATPVIVLTATGTDHNEDIALGYGATDFVDKTRRISILVKRLRLIADGAKTGPEAPEPEEFVIGELALRMKSGRALWRGAEIDLTFTEFRIVEMLATRAGTDLTYREIYDVVHGEGFWAGDGETGYRVNVRSLIKRIRQKFQRIDPDFAEIENYPGYGYRWHAVTARSDVAPEAGERAGNVVAEDRVNGGSAHLGAAAESARRVTA